MAMRWDVRPKDMFINNIQVAHAGLKAEPNYPTIDSYADSFQNLHYVSDFTVVKFVITWSVPYNKKMYDLVMEILKSAYTHEYFEATLHYLDPEQHKPITIPNIVIPGGKPELPKSTEGGAGDVVLEGEYKISF